MMDGSANNRAFMRMHFINYNIESCNYTTEDSDGQKVVLLMDPMVCIQYKSLINELCNLYQECISHVVVGILKDRSMQDFILLFAA